jgi:hypothetical protein
MKSYPNLHQCMSLSYVDEVDLLGIGPEVQKIDS